MNRFPLFASLLVLTAGLCSTMAFGDEPVDPLAGPKVTAKDHPITLLERDSAGKLVRLDERPEAAAAHRMKLTDAQRTAVDAALKTRAVAVNKALWENMNVFLDVQNARQANDREGLAKAMPEFRRVMKPLLDPMLVDQLAETMGAESGKELKRLVDEYLAALAAEEGAGRPGGAGGAKPGSPDEMKPAPMTDAGAETPQPAPLTGRERQRAETNQLMRELGRTLSAVVAERKERTDALLKAAEVTPEQDSKIRAILRRTAGAGSTPSPEARQEQLRLILAELTPAQREKYLKAMRE